MEESNAELESFRQQWRAEVSARSKVEESKAKSKGLSAQQPKRRQAGPSKLIAEGIATDYHEDNDFVKDISRLKGSDIVAGALPAAEEDVGGFGNSGGIREPRSALEHYEKAVERESQGGLGDSLNLYRKAFKMDSQVDQKYKNKHFPPSYFITKRSNQDPTNAYQTQADNNHHSQDGSPLSFKDLILGFQGLSIESGSPEIEGMPAPLCPISKLPHEILVHILIDVAVLDVAVFVRLSQVCKRFAFMVNTEEQIWKLICSSSRFGFGAMHYKWQRQITGELLDRDDFKEAVIEGEVIDPVLDVRAFTDTLLHTIYSSSWQKMFRLRPRIRFNGVYISTVNYIRPGQASPSQITWNSPVHVVTYYRYLRFFRDGTVISLLTTSEPTDVVRFLSKKHQEAHQNGQGAHLPSAVVQSATKGRWRLSSAADHPEAELNDVEGDVYVETEGVGKYVYRMELSFRSVGKGTRNNKLMWKAYWHYNKLTDDWGEFGLRNDKAFFWSRVKSYGEGE